MARIMKIEPLVENVLETHPKTRGDDYLLILEVLSTFITPELPLEQVFKNHVELGIPSLETITRCRRKIQECKPHLKNNTVAEMRAEAEQNFKNYAVSDKVWF